MGMTGCEWSESRKGNIKHALGLNGLPHTHHAGEDAAELAAVFESMIENRNEKGFIGREVPKVKNETLCSKNNAAGEVGKGSAKKPLGTDTQLL
jgi:hypothetical protein